MVIYDDETKILTLKQEYYKHDVAIKLYNKWLTADSETLTGIIFLKRFLH